MAKVQGSNREARPQVLSEAHLEQQICDYLELDGWICRKMELNYSERKRKSVGEVGMPDQMCIRYDPVILKYTPDSILYDGGAQVVWIEIKRLNVGRLSPEQERWHILERKRGALTLIAGRDFPATIDGFILWYQQSGLKRSL